MSVRPFVPITVQGTGSSRLGPTADHFINTHLESLLGLVKNLLDLGECIPLIWRNLIEGNAVVDNELNVTELGKVKVPLLFESFARCLHLLDLSVEQLDLLLVGCSGRCG